MLYEELKKNLKVCKLNSARTEINVRCPYCGDSIKDPYKGHLYIQNTPPYKYYCQRCQTSGRVNNKFLEMVSCENYALTIHIQKEFESYSKKVKIKYGSSLKFLASKKITFSKPYSNLDFTKLKYLEDRLGIKISDDEISKYKIVLSLKKFYTDNNLKFDTNNKILMKTVNTIENNCVGFLSSDKSTIIFRSMDKSKTGYRYSNFTIFPELDSKKTYTISNELDLSSEVFNIYITEGIIDIIGVYNHVMNKEMSSNSLFIANAGKSFIVTSNFIKKLSILNANINIYSDSDVDIDFYKKMMRDEAFYELNGINLYYNNKSKDFGVLKEDIQLSRKIEIW